MANFDQAIEVVLKHEGGYVNHPKDPGGETKFGISKRTYPETDIKNLTRETAKRIYFEDWWVPSRIGLLDSQELANKLFGQGILLGMRTAIKRIQYAARALDNEKIEVDGVLGPITLRILNEACLNSQLHFGLMCSFRAELGAFYRYKRDNPTFIKGWLNRVYTRMRTKLKRG